MCDLGSKIKEFLPVVGTKRGIYVKYLLSQMRLILMNKRRFPLLFLANKVLQSVFFRAIMMPQNDDVVFSRHLICCF